MVTKLMRMVARFRNRHSVELQIRLKSSESQPPAVDPHMHAIPYAIRMGELFPNYKPTDTDLEILANYPMNHSEADLPVLVRTIYSFDKHYTYSDVASTLRFGDEVVATIKAGLAKIDDLQARQLLSRNWYADDRSEMVDAYPWLATHGRATAFTSLVTSGVLPEKASTYVGVINGLRDLIATIYLRTNTCGQLLVWGSDYDRARYYARYRNNKMFHGVALPSDLYTRVDQLADYIGGRELKEALVLGKSEYSIVRQPLMRDDCLYTIHRFDTPMISFFVAGQPVSN
jgi:hypothetical protein